MPPTHAPTCQSEVHTTTHVLQCRQVVLVVAVLRAISARELSVTVSACLHLRIAWASFATAKHTHTQGFTYRAPVHVPVEGGVAGHQGPCQVVSHRCHPLRLRPLVAQRGQPPGAGVTPGAMTHKRPGKKEDRAGGEFHIWHKCQMTPSSRLFSALLRACGGCLLATTR